jgi:hypothetical protein
MVLSSSEDPRGTDLQRTLEQTQGFWTSISEVCEAVGLAQTDPESRRLVELCEKYALTVENLRALTVRTIYAIEDPLMVDVD